MKRVAQLLALVLCVGSLYVGLTVFEVWRVGRTQSTTQVDAIVVMGAAQYDGVPSPLLKARLMRAFELWEQKVAPRIVLTGGNKPGDRFTEASASAIFLRQQGVPQEDLLQESLSRSTYEALRNVRNLVATDSNFAGIKRIVIVTDPYHELRSRLTAREMNFETTTSPSSNSPIAGNSAFKKYVKEGAGIALARVIGFGNLWKITG
jgi:uncharacterized SAM-binding protein YcdF (DUF218 family)